MSVEADTLVYTTDVVRYDYTYTGGKLMQMVVTTTEDGDTPAVDTLNFTYDASGTPLKFTYHNQTFFYVTNLQGDVIAIVDADGCEVGYYIYDAWGNLLDRAGGELIDLNPLRYRGYVYDAETELYYLQSRYYSPKVGRFLNSDIYTSTGQGLIGNNMFAYCNDNPCNYVDSIGTIPIRASLVYKCDDGLTGIIALDAGEKNTNACESINEDEEKSVLNLLLECFDVSAGIGLGLRGSIGILDNFAEISCGVSYDLVVISYSNGEFNMHQRIYTGAGVSFLFWQIGIEDEGIRTMDYFTPWQAPGSHSEVYNVVNVGAYAGMGGAFSVGIDLAAVSKLINELFG